MTDIREKPRQHPCGRCAFALVRLPIDVATTNVRRTQKWGRRTTTGGLQLGRPEGAYGFVAVSQGGRGYMGDDDSDDGATYVKYAAELIRFAAVLVGPSDAEDLFSTAAFTAERWPSIENRRAYLFRAVLHEASKHRRALNGDVGANRALHRWTVTTTADPYELGMQVTSAIGCGWFHQYFGALASQDTAARAAREALHSAHSWPILAEMASTGTWPRTLLDYADAIQDETATSPNSEQNLTEADQQCTQLRTRRISRWTMSATRPAR